MLPSSLPAPTSADVGLAGSHCAESGAESSLVRARKTGKPGKAYRGGNDQLEQKVVSFPGALLLAGSCRRFELLPGVWVSPVLLLPPVPQLELLLHGGYLGGEMGQSWELSTTCPRGAKEGSPLWGAAYSVEWWVSLGVSSP